MSKRHIKTLLPLVLLAGAIVGITRLGAAPAAAELASTPARADFVEVVEAVPFELAQPMAHMWRAERPAFTRGAVLVVRTAPELLLQRQDFNPVLFCGGETVQVLNHGFESGHAIVVVPFCNGETLDDVADVPVFFGMAKLPEQITRNDSLQEMARSSADGMPDVGAERLAAARKDAVALADESALYRLAAELVARYSPGEVDQIRWLRGNE